MAGEFQVRAQPVPLSNSARLAQNKGQEGGGGGYCSVKSLSSISSTKNHHHHYYLPQVKNSNSCFRLEVIKTITSLFLMIP